MTVIGRSRLWSSAFLIFEKRFNANTRIFYLSQKWNCFIFRKVIIDQGLDEPRAICVHPARGSIFWTDWGGKARIEKSFMDGSSRKVRCVCEIEVGTARKNRIFCGIAENLKSCLTNKFSLFYCKVLLFQVLVKKNLQWPNGLTIDYKHSKIFWVDAHHDINRIETCDLTGRKRRIVISSVPHGFAITYVSSLSWRLLPFHTVMIVIAEHLL